MRPSAQVTASEDPSELGGTETQGNLHRHWERMSVGICQVRETTPPRLICNRLEAGSQHTFPKLQIVSRMSVQNAYWGKKSPHVKEKSGIEMKRAFGERYNSCSIDKWLVLDLLQERMPTPNPDTPQQYIKEHPLNRKSICMPRLQWRVTRPRS